MNEDRMNDLGAKAVDVLYDALSASDEMTDSQYKRAMGRARLAASALSSVTRYHQALRARDAMQFMMARELADDTGKLAEYMRITMPQSPVIAQLTNGQR